MPLFGKDGLLGKFVDGIIEGVAGPQASSYPDCKSYLEARYKYATEESARIEKNMREAARTSTANPNDLDKIAKLSEEIRKIKSELGWG